MRGDQRVSSLEFLAWRRQGVAGAARSLAWQWGSGREANSVSGSPFFLLFCARSPIQKREAQRRNEVAAPFENASKPMGLLPLREERVRGRPLARFRQNDGARLLPPRRGRAQQEEKRGRKQERPGRLYLAPGEKKTQPVCSHGGFPARTLRNDADSLRRRGRLEADRIQRRGVNA